MPDKINEKIKKQGLGKNLKSSRSKRPEVPEWLDCAWRRVPCGKHDCPICSRISDFTAKDGGNDMPMEKVLEYMGDNLDETLSIIKQDAKKHGIDISNIRIKDRKRPPRPYEFPLYHKINKWRAGIYEIAEKSNEVSSVWLNVEAGEDILWYANTILAKVYRQLCNNWHIAQGDDYVEFDHEYTAYVLDECFFILKTSLQELINIGVAQKNEFSIALLFLDSLADEVRSL